MFSLSKLWSGNEEACKYVSSEHIYRMNQKQDKSGIN